MSDMSNEFCDKIDIKVKNTIRKALVITFVITVFFSVMMCTSSPKDETFFNLIYPEIDTSKGSYTIIGKEQSYTDGTLTVTVKNSLLRDNYVDVALSISNNSDKNFTITSDDVNIFIYDNTSAASKRCTLKEFTPSVIAAGHSTDIVISTLELPEDLSGEYSASAMLSLPLSENKVEFIL